MPSARTSVVTSILRLRYQGSIDRWNIGIWLASDARRQHTLASTRRRADLIPRTKRRDDASVRLPAGSK